MLIDRGADPNARSNWSGRISSLPLHIAASVGSVEIVDVLLRSGADPHALDLGQQNALDAALHCGRNGLLAGLIRRLMAAGLSRPSLSSVLGIRSPSDDLREALDALIQGGFDPCISSPEFWSEGMQKLFLGPAIGVFLAYGLDPDLRDKYDTSLLHFVVTSEWPGSVPSALMLITAGANPDAYALRFEGTALRPKGTNRDRILLSEQLTSLPIDWRAPREALRRQCLEYLLRHRGAKWNPSTVHGLTLHKIP